jgi:hypothetical protein
MMRSAMKIEASTRNRWPAQSFCTSTRAGARARHGVLLGSKRASFPPRLGWHEDEVLVAAAQPIPSFTSDRNLACLAT